MGKTYKVNIEDMTLENYVTFFNKELYPLNYPYHLKIGLRSKASSEVSLIVQIGIPSETEGENTWYNFQDIMEITAPTDKEVIQIFNKMEFNTDHKEYFKSLWIK